MKTPADDRVKVGNTYQLVEDIYLRDPHDLFAWIYISCRPGKVEVISRRTDTFKNSHNVTDGIEWIRLREVHNGREHPEIKTGTLLRAAGLVEEVDNEGRRFFFEDELHSKPEGFDEPSLSSNSALSALKAQMEAEEAAAEAALRDAIRDPERVLKLTRELPAPNNLVAVAGDKVQVLELTGGKCKIKLNSFPAPIFVSEEDLVGCIAPI